MAAASIAEMSVFMGLFLRIEAPVVYGAVCVVTDVVARREEKMRPPDLRFYPHERDN
jgi:hypothetical protein